MKKNLFILAACGGLYWLCRLWLRDVTAGLLQWFLVCYFSDILAGLALPSIASLILLAVKRPPIKKWWPTVLLLLSAGLVWECLAPLWKPGAVFDWWDFAAYQLGGLLYFLTSNCILRRKNANN